MEREMKALRAKRTFAQAVALAALGWVNLLPAGAQARVLSDRDYTEASAASENKSLTERQRQCGIVTATIKAENDESPCSPEDFAYGARVLASYRAAATAVQDSEFSPNDYGAVASSQSRADLSEPIADQAACAVALSDTYWGSIDHMRVPTHPPSCSDDVVNHGMRLIRDYQRAIDAEDKLP